MHVSRRAPQRDHGTQPYASATLNAWNPKFVPKEVWENEREGFVEVELSSNDHRMTVGIRPSELIMMLTAVPPEVIRESFVCFTDGFSDDIRGDQTIIQPECAVTFQEASERLLALLRGAFDCAENMGRKQT
jgi:hypothetical protein